MTGAIAAPSDVGALSDEELSVGGRVVDGDAASVTLADAFAAITVQTGALPSGASAGGESPFELAAGDLVVLRIRRVPDGFVALELTARHRPAVPGRVAEGETARLVHHGVGANLVARALCFGTIRAFFAERRYLEVDTPALVPSPGLDLHLDAIAAEGGFLMTSPEYQMKRLLVGGVPRAYQISHVFRKGEFGMRHNPEFTMLEWYRAFAGVDDVMADAEELVSRVVATLTGGDEIACPRANVTVTPPFERLPVARAFSRFAAMDEDAALALAERDEEAFYRLLIDVVEPSLAMEPHPIFLVDYPISQASLARRKPLDPRVCERFELYLGGIELCNGFGELTDPREQRDRLLRDQKARAAAGKPVYPLDERFLAALEEGMPPSAGNALGVDRLVALCAGAEAIGEVMPFPAEWL